MEKKIALTEMELDKEYSIKNYPGKNNSMCIVKAATYDSWNSFVKYVFCIFKYDELLVRYSTDEMNKVWRVWQAVGIDIVGTEEEKKEFDLKSVEPGDVYTFYLKKGNQYYPEACFFSKMLYESPIHSRSVAVFEWYDSDKQTTELIEEDEAEKRIQLCIKEFGILPELYSTMVIIK